MSETCKVLAAVTVDGVAMMGEAPASGVYVCTAAGVYAAPAAPIVCGAAAVSTAVGKWATTPAGKELMTMAAEKGCTLVARGGEILLVEGERTLETYRKSAREAESTWKALNTEQGVAWLMRYLSAR